MYIGLDYVPDANNFTYAVNWTYSNPSNYLTFHTTYNISAIWYISVQALQVPSGGKSYAAKFDFVVSNIPVSAMLPTIQQPSGTISLTNGNTIIHAVITLGEDVGNQYTFYNYTGYINLTGNGYTAGACSIQEFMSVLTYPNYTVSGNTYTVWFDNPFAGDSTPVYNFAAVATNTGYIYESASTIFGWSKNAPYNSGDGSGDGESGSSTLSLSLVGVILFSILLSIF